LGSTYLTFRYRNFFGFVFGTNGTNCVSGGNTMPVTMAFSLCHRPLLPLPTWIGVERTKSNILYWISYVGCVRLTTEPPPTDTNGIKPLVFTINGATGFSSCKVRVFFPFSLFLFWFETLLEVYIFAHIPNQNQCSYLPFPISYQLNLDEQVEDIVDSGRTATQLTDHYRQRGAASVKMACLLSKPSRREIEFDPDYLCFEVPDVFVVGYGLDFAEKFRTLPYVGVLKPEAYATAAENGDNN
jgi:hypothetical protein